MTEIIKNQTTIDQVVNDVSGRYDKENLVVNFYEWLLIRQVAVAWSVSCGEKTRITRDEVFDMAFHVMPQYKFYLVIQPMKEL